MRVNLNAEHMMPTFPSDKVEGCPEFTGARVVAPPLEFECTAVTRNNQFMYTPNGTNMTGRGAKRADDHVRRAGLPKRVTTLEHYHDGQTVLIEWPARQKLVSQRVCVTTNLVEGTYRRNSILESGGISGGPKGPQALHLGGC